MLIFVIDHVNNFFLSDIFEKTIIFLLGDLCISCRRTTIFDDLDRADVYERSSGLDLCFDENDNIMFTDESS